MSDFDFEYKIGGKDYMYEESSGRWFHRQTGSLVRNKIILSQLENATGRRNRVGKISRQKTVNSARKQALTRLKKVYGKYFSSKSVAFTNRGGHIQGWAKTLTLKGGKDPNLNWHRPQFRATNGKLIRASSKTLWGANINSNTPATILVGTKQWVRQIQISLHALYVNAENFRIFVGQRAIKVFQNSFKYQQFYSSRTQRWKPLSAWTLKKRAWRGTGSRILKEYSDLYNSIKIDENAGPMTTRVYTDIVPANAGHHKRHSICYAGYHNEGKGTYGSGWNGHKPKPYIRRQFMGHSSHLNPFTDSFMKKMMKMYLFDSVFLIKKT